MAIITGGTRIGRAVGLVLFVISLLLWMLGGVTVYGAVRSICMSTPEKAKRYGLKIEQGTMTSASPLSLNNVVEICTRDEERKKVYHWIVNIREGERLGFRYELRDLDLDGTPDVIEISLPEVEFAYSLVDVDADGNPDIQTLEVPSGIGNIGNCIRYSDRDLDGRLDEMSEIANGQVVLRYVLIDDLGLASNRDKGGVENPEKGLLEWGAEDRVGSRLK